MSRVDLHQGSLSGLLRLASRLRARKPEIDPLECDAEIIGQSGLFDPAGYLRVYPDVAASGMDPIRHYVRHGAGEGRNPCALFDTRFYQEENPDVVASGMNPFRHFCEFGWKEWRNPSAAFGMAGYAASCMGDLAGTMNPLVHRMQNPQKAGRRHASDAEIIRQSGLFDPDYYLGRYPEVSRAGLDPVEHYVRLGAAEGKNPSAHFNTDYYRSNNPDVARSGMNPFRHFCEFGWNELRNPSEDFDIAWYWLVHMLPDGVEGNPLLHYQRIGQASGLETKKVGALADEDIEKLGALAEQMLGREGNDAFVFTRLGRILTGLKRWPAAESAFRDATGLEWNSAKNHNRLAQVLARQEKWWQVAESLLAATALDPSHASWFHRLGEAQEKMNRFELAAQAYRQAIELRPEAAIWHYHLGYALERCDQQEQADAYYTEAIDRDERQEVKQFGVGAFHQSLGRWQEAVAAYRRAITDNPLDAELRYRQGMAYDRCYQWEEACIAYETAIALNADIPYWHYRLGYVLERMQHWNGAAEAYGAAATRSDKFIPYWHYRQAYALQKAGCHEQACHAYLRTRARQTLDGTKLLPIPGDNATGAVEGSAVSTQTETANGYLRKFAKPLLIEDCIRQDGTNAEWHFLLGQQYERLRNWEVASHAYGDAIARKDDHAPEWYYRLGFVLFQAGCFAEACLAFQETRILRRAYGVDSQSYERNPYQKSLMEYNEYLDNLPISKNTVLYESYAGLGVNDNPNAIFEYLLKNIRYSEWKHIWVVADRSIIPKQYLANKNIIFVARGTDLYRRYLATASHLVNNATFPTWFIRREGQRYLNTWHGTPLKTLGKDIRGNFMERANTARNFLHCTHIISPNVHTSDVLLDRYDIASIYGGKLAETGYPRIDRLVRSTDEAKAALRERLGLSVDKPVVLYAPTWRGTLGNATLEVEQLADDMAALADDSCQIVFRGHYFAEKHLDALALPVTIAPQDVEACDLLSIADVLITDYSSIFFDYLPAERPILYYAHDLEQYAQERGLYFDIDSMPGVMCRTIPELKDALTQALENPLGETRHYSNARSRFCPHEDGQATRRVVEFFFDDSEECIVRRYADTKRSLLFFVGAFPPQGITASALNLLRSLDPVVDAATLVIDPTVVGGDPDKIERFSHVPESVHVIGRCGTMVQSPEERWVRDSLNRRHTLEPGMRAVYMEAFRRDYYRMFGNSRFDAIVNFDGYSVYWASLLAAGAYPGTRKVIYMHNDMRAEHEVRFPNLAGVFMVYKEYDALVSVSEVMRDTNRDRLSSALGLDPGMFDYCDNTINTDELNEKAQGPLDTDLASWMAGKTTFVNLGRLSPEKGHAKLIRAFSNVHNEHHDTRLLILGKGPLEHDLQALIASMGLEGAVLLAGLRPNPFPPLSQCDCFVLSSDHEGQPMVLLEAMTFGRPIIATDIDGNRGVLEKNDHYGLLVNNSVDGLTEGMRAFLSGGITGGGFDSRSYQEKAMRMFHEVVVGEERDTLDSKREKNGPVALEG